MTYYVYILRSISFPDQTYIGYTKNLTDRLKTHNAGNSNYTSKYIPWEIATYVAFSDLTKAIAFEKYLKTNAGKMLPNQRLL